jgi:hypothetical protein
VKPYPEHPDEQLVRYPLGRDEIDRFLRHPSWFVRQECILYQHRLKTISLAQLVWAIDNDPHPLNRQLARSLLQEMPRLSDEADDGPAAGPDN